MILPSYIYRLKKIKGEDDALSPFPFNMVCLQDSSVFAPVFGLLAQIALVTDLCHLLSLGEQFFGFVRICLLDAQITDLAHQEVVELCPVWFL